MTLKAPFPWFGGKSRAASLVWERFGDVPNYVEPFAGSLAVLLARPTAPGFETVNDRDGHLCNFWRAAQADPAAVAAAASWPVIEVDLHARHRELTAAIPGLVAALAADPAYYDARLAGWWLWGVGIWIGQGWCGGRAGWQLPSLFGAGRGIHALDARDRIPDVLAELAARLRRVRVVCGNWDRILGPSVTYATNGTKTLTGVVLDPPYDDGAIAYAGGQVDLQAVRSYAIEAGANPLMRVALCGYDGEHEMPADWECVPWKARGGYGSQGDGAGRENAGRERVWFSPACLRPQRSLFDTTPPAEQVG